MTYEEYVEKLMELLFQALARPAPGEEEPASSQEGEGQSTEKKRQKFLVQGVYKVFPIWYIIPGAVRWPPAGKGPGICSHPGR